MKGQTVFVAGSGKDLHVFESMEACERYSRDYGRSFRPRETEVYAEYTLVMVEWTGCPLVPYSEQDVCRLAGQLSDLIREQEHDLEHKDFGRAGDSRVGGMWKWCIRKDGSDLWESCWYLPEPRHK